MDRRIAWWVAIGATFLLYLQLWIHSALDKWKALGDDPFPPQWFVDQFTGSLFEFVPGLSASWVVLAILETLAAFAWIVSLVRGEFLPNRERPWIAIASAISALAFAALAFGQNLTGQFSGTFTLTLYFAVAMLTPFMVEWFDRWLSGAPRAPTSD